MSKRYYEELLLGEQRESQPQVVEREHILDFAKRYEPQYFHADVEAARKSIFGEVIASGNCTAALWRQRQDPGPGNLPQRTTVGIRAKSRHR